MSTAYDVQTLRDFLLLIAAGDLGMVDKRAGRRLRTAVLRHDDRTMTVLSSIGIETITRCSVCPKEEVRPCTALRVLALPYARHPAYRSEWSLIPTPVSPTPH